MKSQDFASRVIEVVKLIPKGRVTTYGAIANFLGTGGSARTVGYVLGHSIEALSIPAHRVVNSAGLLTGKNAFGPGVMEQKLKDDGVEVLNDKVLNFKSLLWNPALEL
jgi:methylated-DNA-protein-cysteine methyltransferase-like protein